MIGREEMTEYDCLTSKKIRAPALSNADPVLVSHAFLNAMADDVAKLEDALKMVEWQTVHDPDTHEVLGHLCLWCHRKPHALTCPRQLALGEQK